MEATSYVAANDCQIPGLCPDGLSYVQKALNDKIVRDNCDKGQNGFRRWYRQLRLKPDLIPRHWSAAR